MSTKYEANILQPVISARFWPEEHPFIIEAAKASGLSRAEFAQRAIRQACGLPHPPPHRPKNTVRRKIKYPTRKPVLRKV